MKAKKFGRKSALVVVGLLSLGLMGAASVGWSKDGAAKAVQPLVKPPPAKPERHVLIRACIKQLEKIREDLDKAEKDLSGHRVTAVKDIDHALKELRVIIQADEAASKTNE